MEKHVSWTAEALGYLDTVPGFVRDKAKEKIELYVKGKGGTEVTVDDVKEVFEKEKHGS